MLDFQSVQDKIAHIKSSLLTVLLFFHEHMYSPSFKKYATGELQWRQLFYEDVKNIYDKFFLKELEAIVGNDMKVIMKNIIDYMI